MTISSSFYGDGFRIPSQIDNSSEWLTNPKKCIYIEFICRSREEICMAQVKMKNLIKAQN